MGRIRSEAEVLKPSLLASQPGPFIRTGNLTCGKGTLSSPTRLEGCLRSSHSGMSYRWQCLSAAANSWQVDSSSRRGSAQARPPLWTPRGHADLPCDCGRGRLSESGNLCHKTALRSKEINQVFDSSLTRRAGQAQGERAGRDGCSVDRNLPQAGRSRQLMWHSPGSACGGHAGKGFFADSRSLCSAGSGFPWYQEEGWC